MWEGSGPEGGVGSLSSSGWRGVPMSDSSLVGDTSTAEPWRRHAPHQDVDRVDAYRRRLDANQLSSERPDSVRSARAAGRLLITSDGMRWLVYELDLRAYRDGASLVFESENVVRRLRTFPAAWRELSDAKLADLCRDR